MTTLQKYVLAVAASLAVSATGVQGYVRPGQMLCTSGYVVDAKSIAENANTLLNPQNFPVQSLVDAALSDDDNKFYLLRAPTLYGELFTQEWELTGIDKLMQLAIENGVCDSCLESGTVERGLEIEFMGMVMNLYPPTLQIRQIMLRSPDYQPCREFTVTPTFSPTDKPTKPPTPSPTNKPTPVPTSLAPTTLQPTSMPVTPMPTLFPTKSPTGMPTPLPTNMPTKAPTSGAPTLRPTETPSLRAATIAPSVNVFTEVSEFISSNQNSNNGNNVHNDTTESITAPFENDISTGTTDTTNNGNRNSNNNNAAPDQGDESAFGFSSGSSSNRPQGRPYQPADAWAVQAGLNNLENRDYGDPFASGAAAWTFTVSAAAGLISLLMMA